MEEIVQWLRKIEQHACEIYRESAAKLSHNRDFSTFLSQLAEDESWHYHIMGSAAIQIREAQQAPKSGIIFDDTTANLMEKPLLTLSERIENNVVSEQDVIDCIVSAELSEWNKIFLYVVNTFRNESKEFQYAASSIQAHQEKIKNFLKALPHEYAFSREVLDLPFIWEKNILIVEDDEALRELVTAVLSGFGHTETAENGLIASEKYKTNFYDIIISDINMPIMNGLEFFEKAKGDDAKAAQRFIFYSSNLTDENQRYFSEHDITYIQKPFNVFEFREVVQKKISMTL